MLRRVESVERTACSSLSNVEWKSLSNLDGIPGLQRVHKTPKTRDVCIFPQQETMA